MLPSWLIKKSCSARSVHQIKAQLRRHRLHTVCEEASCPNLGECFSRKTATFMILGNICTRSCGFCEVESACHSEARNTGRRIPRTQSYKGDSSVAGSLRMTHMLPPPDPNEPAEIAKIAQELNLRHVVVTSVTRDDLPDEGAGQFAKTIFALKGACSNITIEVLTPDFHARPDCLTTVCTAGPNIFNHNIETTRRLTPLVRSNADYDRTLTVLKWISTNFPRIIVKSGLMVGLGETCEEVVETLNDLCKASCSLVTIGQYLRPRRDKLAVVEYVRPEVFEEYKHEGERLGIRHVFSGPFVRSSYMADKEAIWIVT